MVEKNEDRIVCTDSVVKMLVYFGNTGDGEH